MVDDGSRDGTAEAVVALGSKDSRLRLVRNPGNRGKGYSVRHGMLEALGLGGEANNAKRLTVLRAIDKLDRLGVDGVKALLGPGRKDESGDFTKGAGLTASDADVLLSIFASPQTPADQVLTKILRTGNSISEQGVIELRQISDLVSAAKYDDRVKIDPSVVRGLEYYTGPVFEVELTFAADDAADSPRFGNRGNLR